MVSDVFAALPQIPQNTQQTFESGSEHKDTISHEGSFFDMFCTPIKDESKNTCGAIAVVIDISQQKNAQNALEKYRAEMEKNKMLAAVGALSTEIASEISQPLVESRMMLLKLSSSLKKMIGAADVKENVQQCIEKIAQSIKTLDGFCSKANLKTPARTEPVHLLDIVERILSVFQQAAQDAMVRIQTEGADIFPSLSISSRELEQLLYIMFQNLIHSADGNHVHDLNVKFSIRKDDFAIDFCEKCLVDSVHTPAHISTIFSEILTGQSQNVFGFSVLKGIIDSYSGQFSINPDEKGKLHYQILLPLSK
jgi:hypothetical protein